MKHNINILNKIADLVGDMDMFYCITIWKNDVRLQGNNLDIALPQFVWVQDLAHTNYVVHTCVIKFELVKITLVSVQDNSNTIHDKIEY